MNPTTPTADDDRLKKFLGDLDQKLVDIQRRHQTGNKEHDDALWATISEVGTEVREMTEAAIQQLMGRKVVEGQIETAHRFRDDAYNSPDKNGRSGWWFSEQYWNELITELQARLTAQREGGKS